MGVYQQSAKPQWNLKFYIRLLDGHNFPIVRSVFPRFASWPNTISLVSADALAGELLKLCTQGAIGISDPTSTPAQTKLSLEHGGKFMNMLLQMDAVNRGVGGMRPLLANLQE